MMIVRSLPLATLLLSRVSANSHEYHFQGLRSPHLAQNQQQQQIVHSTDEELGLEIPAHVAKMIQQPQQEHVDHHKMAHSKAEEMCRSDAESLCMNGSSLPPMYPPFVDFTFVMDPTPLLTFDTMLLSMLTDIEKEFSEPETVFFYNHRRLEEKEEVKQNKYLFDCPQVHSCLVQAHQQEQQIQRQLSGQESFFLFHPHRLLSKGCSDSLIRLEQVKSAITEKKMPMGNLEMSKEFVPKGKLEMSLNEDEDDTMLIVIDLLWWASLLGIFVLTLNMLTSKIRERRMKMVQHSDRRRRLKRSILRTIYSNPKLKSEVENAMGETIGAFPPLPMSVQKIRQLRKKIRMTKLIMIMIVMSVFTTLVLIDDDEATSSDDEFSCCAPFYFVSALLFAVLLKLHLRARMMMSQMNLTEDCTCCCCGGSASDVQNGTVSKAQACCNCCKGTGVCPPSCTLCCTDGTCSCCDGAGCCCCSPSGCCGEDSCCGKSATCCGKDGCCCCCGAASGADRGILTEKQASCECCGGSGCCGSKCDCCDDNDQCCAENEKKKIVIRSSERVVYDGVPVTVV